MLSAELARGLGRPYHTMKPYMAIMDDKALPRFGSSLLRLLAFAPPFPPLEEFIL